MDSAESSSVVGASRSADGQGPAVPREFEICSAAELPPGAHMIATVGQRQLGIFNIRGELFALPNICPHQTGPACAGKRLVGSLRADRDTNWTPEWILDGEVMVCPWHGLEYHVPTGTCLAFPSISLRRYRVILRDGTIVVQL